MSLFCCVLAWLWTFCSIRSLVLLCVAVLLGVSLDNVIVFALVSQGLVRFARYCRCFCYGFTWFYTFCSILSLFLLCCAVLLGVSLDTVTVFAVVSFELGCFAQKRTHTKSYQTTEKPTTVSSQMPCIIWWGCLARYCRWVWYGLTWCCTLCSIMSVV